MSTVTAVVRPIPQPEPEKEVVLTMSMETAKILLSLTGSICGDARSTYRSVTDAIYAALQKAGVPNSDWQQYFIGFTARTRA